MQKRGCDTQVRAQAATVEADRLRVIPHMIAEVERIHRGFRYATAANTHESLCVRWQCPVGFEAKFHAAITHQAKAEI